MPFNGTGSFTRLYSWTSDQANGIPAQGARFDGDANDFATGFGNCVTRDGQGYFTADINANGFALKSLKQGSAASPAVYTAAGVGIYFPSGTGVALATGGVVALTIDSAQNVSLTNQPTSANHAATKTYVDTNPLLPKLASANVFTNQQAVTPYRANISGAVSIDLAATAKSNSLFLTLTGNVTSFALTNPVDGASYNIKLIQGGGGGFTFAALPSAWKFASGTAPTFTAGAAGTHDLLVAIYDATLTQYDASFSKAMS